MNDWRKQWVMGEYGSNTGFLRRDSGDVAAQGSAKCSGWTGAILAVDSKNNYWQIKKEFTRKWDELNKELK